MSKRVDLMAAPARPRLVIDDTTAHITVCAEQAPALWAWFRRENIDCTRRHGAGVGGLDVIDFGDPSPETESLIRSVFDSWYKQRARAAPRAGG